jgi:predicted nucleotidyltransferase
MEPNPRVRKAGGAHVSAFLATAVAAWQSVLGRNLAGVYVHGSLATGAYNPRTSDIDVVVATRSLTDIDANARIAELHRAMLGWGGERCADRVDVLFPPLKALTSERVPDLAILELHPDEGFTLQPLGPDFIILKHVLRTSAIRLVGRDLGGVIPVVTPGELREAAIANLRAWWLPQLEFPGRFLDNGYQVYAVLTMCRMLCLLVTGEVVTKPEAAAWALRGPYLQPWWDLVRAAVAYPSAGALDHRVATLDLIRFALDEAGIGHDAPSS